MPLAAKHFDIVIGIDVHIVQPPGTVPPAPIPHAFVGIVFDPFDYIPLLGATVMVNGLPRAQAGSVGFPIPSHVQSREALSFSAVDETSDLMENDVELLRSLFHSEADYRQAEQWWAGFWAEIPGSTPWQSPWLNTRFADGSLMHDGDGILSAKHPEAGRAFKIIQESEEDGAVHGRITWWKQTWDPDDENLAMLVIVLVPSTKALEFATQILSAWAQGDEVADHGDERWVDGGTP